MKSVARGVVLLSGVLVGCGNSAVPSGPTPNASTPSNSTRAYEGTWTGQTGQSKPLSFVAVDNQLSRIEFTYMLSPTQPGCSGMGWLLLDNVAATLSSTALEITFTQQKQLSLSFRGNFDSPTDASGMLSLSVDGEPSKLPGAPMPCGGTLQTTWTAHKS